MKKFEQLVALLMAATMVLSLAACGKSGTENGGDAPANPSGSPAAETPAPAGESSGETLSAKQTPEGTLVVGYNCEADSLDPAEQSEGSPSIKNIVYETLMVRNWDTGTYEPWLATDWTFDDDLTMTIHLRDDVTFSNGDPMTSEDVLYTVSRYVNSSRLASSFAFIDLDSCYAEDDYTVVLKFNTPTGAAEGYIAGMMVYNKGCSEETGRDAMTTEC